ncbi:MAG: DUF3098 domain-containing protein [Bacteroidetes bacterium]|nr:DUF3098 domain-containing protein [Bacteroidota bacterium]
MSNKQNTDPVVKKINTGNSSQMVFGIINYLLLGASLLILVAGFALMSGTTDIYSSAKITTAPILVMLGFALGIVSIFYKGKTN